MTLKLGRFLSLQSHLRTSFQIPSTCVKARRQWCVPIILTWGVGRERQGDAKGVAIQATQPNLVSNSVRDLQRIS